MPDKAATVNHPVAMDRVALDLLEQEQADEYHRMACPPAAVQAATTWAPMKRTRLPQLLLADALEDMADDLGPNRGLPHKARLLARDIRAEFREIPQ